MNHKFLSTLIENRKDNRKPRFKIHITVVCLKMNFKSSIAIDRHHCTNTIPAT